MNLSASASGPADPRFTDRLSYLLGAASIELTVREVVEAAPYRRLLRRGTQVYIPHVPSVRLADTVMAAKALKSDGMMPVPHIAARRLASEAELDDFLDHLREAGCEEALVISGDVARPEGPFVSALDILASGRLERAGFTRIGIAGYPEGNPSIAEGALVPAMLAKARLAQQGAFEMYVLTQFSFDVDAIIRWESNTLASGITLPIHVGMPGVTRTRNLLRYAALCGVRASATFLKHGTGAVAKLLTRWRPTTMVAQLAMHSLQHPSCLMKQLHFFPFGGFPETVAWMNAIARGEYSVYRSGDRVIVALEEDEP